MTARSADRPRCFWVSDDPLYIAYHDEEWGVPVHDERHLFEMLILEGAQAGLSWITVLRRRESYRRAFDGFDPEKIAAYGPDKVAALLADQGIVRNRAKVEATIANARACLRLRDAPGGVSGRLWRVVGGGGRRARRPGCSRGFSGASWAARRCAAAGASVPRCRPRPTPPRR